ncbi:DUF1275 domain-containing protein [Acuticoccus sediminis]|uniref:DUF1275 domain-containing protein n=1 Tax=Acuticoccus sediminis TaxID=2184697 RepID=A0A8B2NVZ4_9HYPH|nr:YoaK family protein [Acuticoccus sediminis]RAI01953.1 DUF1275 domain-containing protein [Acuticoccus sediminis]
MAFKITTQDKALPCLLLLLSLTTGLVDAISVLGLGKVFTANMTGNVVFLGFATMGVPGFGVAPYIVALASFLTGAAVAGRTVNLTSSRPRSHWLLAAATIEGGLLLISAVIALDYDIATLQPAGSLYAIIALTGLAMGLRNATIRQLKVPDMTTTVLTLTLTGLAAESTLGGGSNPNWFRRIASVVAIFLGAAIGAALVTTVGLSVPLALAGGIVLLATIGLAILPRAPE